SSWCVPFLSLLSFFRVNQTIVIGIEFLEHVARSKEFLPAHVAVIVSVHALEPDWADRRPRQGDDTRHGRFTHPAGAEQLEAAAEDFEVQAPGRIGRAEDGFPGLAKGPKRGGRGADLAQAYPAVVVAVERLEEPVAEVVQHDVAAGGGG